MDRTAFVTGGAGGIGAAIVRGLADAGHRVAIADLAVDAARALAEETGGVGVELDVTEPGSVTAAVRRTRDTLGAIDVCVNCAGWDELRPFVDTDEAFAARVLEINLAGPIRVTRAVLPDMIERRFGRLIHVASDAGRVGSSLEAIYSSAKGGLIAFSKTIAREVARHGVTSNAICPGPTDTPLLQGVAAGSDDADRVIASMTRAPFPCAASACPPTSPPPPSSSPPTAPASSPARPSP